ncbi:MAG: hypothetical protein QOJ24_217 [Mycobacterium sp.]|jgi:hypothetical protein|nr:hypothetical protein [Mycobacterium sp.]
MTGPIRAATLAITAAAVAFASPAVATAEPREWDIGAYDQCVGSFDGNPATSAADYKRWEDHMKMCCDKSGGVYKYSGNGGCESPPKEQAEAWHPDSVLPSQTLTPVMDLPAGTITVG